jgi:SAM-dependent methyltransferase
MLSKMPQRRVAGYHDIRMDGMVDLIMRARGASVLDIGCNRGLVGFEFAVNGAALVHGCDIYEAGIATAREVFADLRSVKSQFECIDLTIPGALQEAFGDQKYDIVLMLATYHKLKRIMSTTAIEELMCDIGNRTLRYFAWRGTSKDIKENVGEIKRIDKYYEQDFKRIHRSGISEALGECAIWQRKT